MDAKEEKNAKGEAEELGGFGEEFEFVGEEGADVGVGVGDGRHGGEGVAGQ